MKPRPFVFNRLSTSQSPRLVDDAAFNLKMAAFVAVCMFSTLDQAHAAAIAWDNGGGDQLWSNTANWNPDSAAAANDLTFGETGKGATGTATNIVDATLSINSLSYLNTGTAATNTHTTQINNGQTLTIAGTGTAFNVGTATSASTSVAITGSGGGGALSITGGTSANFTIGAGTNPSGSQTQFLDMSALPSFSANVGLVQIGTGARNAGSVTLGTTNSITATSIAIGNNTATGGPVSLLSLGQTNTINSDTFTIAVGRSGGTLNFRTGLTGATVVIRNRAGTGAANLNVGLTDTNASGGPTGTVDFSGGSIDAQFGTVTLGRSANGTAGGTGTGNLTFGAGTMSATAMNVGNGNTGSSATATGIGNVTMTSGAGTLTATTVTLGVQTNNNNVARLNAANGTFTQNGGTAAITNLIIGDRQNTSPSGNVTGTYNLAGGTLKAQNIQAGNNGSGGGTATRAFNWTAGTIQNLNSTTDLTIASTNGLSLTLSGAGTKTFSADSGRTITVNAPLSGSAGFTKDGSGNLTLTGNSSSYSGPTTVSAGTLLVNGSLGTAAVSVTGGTLGGTGTIGGAVTVDSGATVSPGASIESLGVASATISGTLLTEFDGTGLGTIDLLSVSGLLNITNATVDFNQLVASLDDPYYIFATYGSLSGTQFSSVVDLPSGYGIDYAFNDGLTSTNIALVAVPEPAAALLGSIGLLAILRRRRN